MTSFVGKQWYWFGSVGQAADARGGGSFFYTCYRKWNDAE
jgi:hypothetical protein